MLLTFGCCRQTFEVFSQLWLCIYTTDAEKRAIYSRLPVQDAESPTDADSQRNPATARTAERRQERKPQPGTVRQVLLHPDGQRICIQEHCRVYGTVRTWWFKSKKFNVWYCSVIKNIAAYMDQFGPGDSKVSLMSYIVLLSRTSPRIWNSSDLGIQKWVWCLILFCYQEHRHVYGTVRTWGFKSEFDVLYCSVIKNIATYIEQLGPRDSKVRVW